MANVQITHLVRNPIPRSGKTNILCSGIYGIIWKYGNTRFEKEIYEKGLLSKTG